MEDTRVKGFRTQVVLVYDGPGYKSNQFKLEGSDTTFYLPQGVLTAARANGKAVNLGLELKAGDRYLFNGRLRTILFIDDKSIYVDREKDGRYATEREHWEREVLNAPRFKWV